MESGKRLEPSSSLPYSYKGTDDTHCTLEITPSSAKFTSDEASWYEIWEGTTAIWSVCLRHGEGGSVSGIGEFYTSSNGVATGLIRAGIQGTVAVLGWTLD